MASAKAKATKAKRERLAADARDFAPYRYRPEAYIREVLGFTPVDIQIEVIEQYRVALIKQIERREYENGKLTIEQLKYYKPGEIIRFKIRVPAGHNTGKTKLASWLVSHFFDCFGPCVIYTYAPTENQIRDLLWKEIKTDRARARLPGKAGDLRLTLASDHFARGRATVNLSKLASHSIHGVHAPYQMHVIDEATGVQGFVFDAVDSMTSGGVCVVLYLSNPETRACRFYREAARPDVASVRMSCLDHPNIVEGRSVIPGAVTRQWIETQVATFCDIVDAHDEERHTFELPYRPGTIYRPKESSDFVWRVLGITPASASGDTVVSSGTYDAATRRVSLGDAPHVARVGVDVARFGDDRGTIYVHRAGRLYRAGVLFGVDTRKYLEALETLALELARDGVTDLELRVDGTGGYGAGVVDSLGSNPDVARMFDTFRVVEIVFGAAPFDGKAYRDNITEIYFLAAEVLKDTGLGFVGDALEIDLTDRRYDYVQRGARRVRSLESKDDFKKRNGRSPDDGDGAVLALAPDYAAAGRVGTGGAFFSER